MIRQEAEQLLRRIVIEVERCHPGLRTDTVNELLAVGELRVCLEILCDNLVEDALPVDGQCRADIAAVGSFLGIPAEYWQALVVA